MNQALVNNKQQEWLKVLGKGMVTLPKQWRDELGIESGDILKARKKGNMVVIEPQQSKSAPYRVYSDNEIDDFLKTDALSPSFAKKVQDDLTSK